METDRFEALIDAILAIIITILVLELSFASTGTWDALYELRYDFLLYAMSFIVCFDFWNYNNNLFSIVNKIDSKVVWSMGITLFVFSFLPYITLFVGEHFFLFFPQFVYGLYFITIVILLIINSKLLKKTDPANIALYIILNKQYSLYGTIPLILIGIFIGYFIYPPAITVCCFISLFGVWIIPKIQYHLK